MMYHKAVLARRSALERVLIDRHMSALACSSDGGAGVYLLP